MGKTKTSTYPSWEDGKLMAPEQVSNSLISGSLKDPCQKKMWFTLYG